MKKVILSILKTLFFLGIGGLFIWLFTKDLSAEQEREILNSFSNAGYGWIILSIVIAIISHVIRTLRWQMLMKPMGYHASFRNVFMALMIGYFANLALPRLGEVTRCGFLARYEQIPFQKSFGTVVAERAFDLLTFIVLFIVNFILQYELLHQYVDEKILTPLSQKFTIFSEGYFPYLCLGGFLLLIALFFLLRKPLRRFTFFRKIMGILRGFWDGLKSLTQLKQPGLFLLYTLGIWLMYFLMTYFCFYSIAEMSHMGMMAGFSVLVLGTIGIMVVQGGIGIYPAIVAETLVLYGAVSTKAYAMGWLIWSAQTLTIILAGIVALLLFPVINRYQHGNDRNYSEKVAKR